ncbi:MAG: hypothetical protein M1827_000420 [Pycnora praestabilis]|nr:MAG: hypothetical protein M1827_000420 [Pycnora praestabilis]
MQSSHCWKQRSAIISANPEVRLHYIDCTPSSSSSSSDSEVPYKGTILLIHGFPQTCHQYRHVITPLSSAGYRVIVPDYRGAGQSSHPAQGFTKSVMARDMMQLVTDRLGIKDKIHVVGHDIGGMIAHAYASRYPDHVASVLWGECPLPGTRAYEENKVTLKLFHFVFHSVLDLPEALVAGREGIYLKHFFDKLALNTAAITTKDLEHYTLMYEQPGAMRCAFNVYRAFEEDAGENRTWLRDQGKCRVPALALNGEGSGVVEEAEGMIREMYENVEVAIVEESGHYIAEENPDGFVREVLAFVGKHTSR